MPIANQSVVTRMMAVDTIEQRIHDVLRRHQGRFYSYGSSDSLASLSERYRGKIDVWIESFDRQ